MDRVYHVLMLNINFDDWYVNSVSFGQKMIRRIIVFSVGSRDHHQILLVVIFLVVLTAVLLLIRLIKKKMPAKVLMCPCYADLFESNEENKYIKKLCIFIVNVKMNMDILSILVKVNYSCIRL